MVLAWQRGRWAERGLWFLLLFVSLLFSLGDAFPPNRVIYQLPGFSFFRCHARWLSMAVLAAALLAGYGCDRLLGALKEGRYRRPVGVLIALVLFCDLNFFVRPLVSFLDRGAQEAAPKALSALSRDGRYFTYRSLPIFAHDLPARAIPPELYAEYFSARETLNANLGMRFGLSSVQVYAGLHPSWVWRVLSEPTIRDLSRMNCRYLISEGAAPVPGLREIWKNRFFRIYENTDVEARVRLAAGVAPTGDRGVKSVGRIRGQARILESVNQQELTVALHTEEAGVLLLADTFYPGWRAWINGKEAKIRRVDGWMRAVSVPKGESRVLFSYRPASFVWGLRVGGAGLLLALAVLGVWARQRRKTVCRDLGP
jgi:hypothetical protein